MYAMYDMIPMCVRASHHPILVGAKLLYERVECEVDQGKKTLLGWFGIAGGWCEHDRHHPYKKANANADAKKKKPPAFHQAPCLPDCLTWHSAAEKIISVNAPSWPMAGSHFQMGSIGAHQHTQRWKAGLLPHPQPR